MPPQPKEPPHPVGKLLEQIRRDRGITTQRDFARDTLNMNDAHYRRVLTHGAGDRVLRRLANQLGIDHRRFYEAQAFADGPPPNGTAERLDRLERKLDAILDALIQTGTIPDPPDDLHELLANTAPPPQPKKRRRT